MLLFPIAPDKSVYRTKKIKIKLKIRRNTNKKERKKIK